MSENSKGARHSLSIKIGQLVEAYATGAGIIAVVLVVALVFYFRL